MLATVLTVPPAAISTESCVGLEDSRGDRTESFSPNPRREEPGSENKAFSAILLNKGPGKLPVAQT